ncbi:MAG: hypothetical protein WBS24_08480 [Terriglobales bacterium]
MPNIVHSRLWAAGQTAETTHPEADLLIAFSEQSLLPSERESVLAHLALCADCREVALLALPPLMADATIPPAPLEAETVGANGFSQRVSSTGGLAWFSSGGLGWGSLRWAALAAGIAVAVFVMRPGGGHLEKPPAAANQARMQAEPKPPTQVAGLPPEGDHSVVASTAVANAAGNSISSPSESTSAAAAPTSAPPIPRRTITASQQVAQDQGSQLTEPQKNPDERPIANRTADTESVEVASAGNLTDRASAPAVEKAKPALDESAFWTISAGVLKRSLDGGQNWKTVLRGKHTWRCYAARGQEVWAGGANGALERSTDGGSTWNTIVVAGAGESLRSDVIQIDLQNPAGIVLETANHQTWSSSDSGQSWQKK